MLWLETFWQAYLRCTPNLVSHVYRQLLKQPLTKMIVVFNRIGSKEMQLFWPSIILFILASCITVPVYVIYWKGPAIRARSVFACELARLREVTEAASRSGTLADPDQIARIRNRFSTTNQSLGLRTPRHSIALATPRHSVEQRDDHAANIAESRGPSQE